MIEQDDDDKIILFGPRNGKSILKLYPEIAGDIRFKGLSPDEIYFAWLMGIPNSPCDEAWKISIRLTTAASKSIKDRDKRHVFESGQYPDEVKVAINAFSNFLPEARMAAKVINQRALLTYKKLSAVDVDKDFIITKTVGKGNDKEEITEIDWSGKNSYTNIISTINKALPDLLKNLEEGFGVTEKQKSEEVLGSKSIDKYVNSKKDKAS